jgi:hypothetical protein
MTGDIMKARLITLALALSLGAVACDWQPVEVCNKRVNPSCRTIYVQQDARSMRAVR